MTALGNGSFKYADSNRSYTATRNDSGGYDIGRLETSSYKNSYGMDRDDRGGNLNSENYHVVNGNGQSPYKGISKEQQQEADLKKAISSASYLQNMANAKLQYDEASNQSKALAISLAQTEQLLKNENQKIENLLSNLNRQQEAAKPVDKGLYEPTWWFPYDHYPFHL